MIGLWVVLATLAVATAIGLTLRARDGRIRLRRNPKTDTDGAHGPEMALPAPVTEALSPDHEVTLVQLSTTFCAPCRHARAVLSTLATDTHGVAHAELDITDQPDVARELGVLRTPTTLALTAEGHEVLRISGVPRSAGLRQALDGHLSRSTQREHPSQ